MKECRRLIVLLFTVLVLGTMFPMAAYAATVNESDVTSVATAAKNAIGKTRSELKLPDEPWCGRFAGYCINNSKIAKSLGTITTTQCAYAIDLADWVCNTKKAGTFYVFSSAHQKRVKEFYPDLKKPGRLVKTTSSAFTPKVGDFVEFSWHDWEKHEFDHVGIVSKVTENYIMYIDGNSSSGKGKVASHSMKRSSSDIIGYVRIHTDSSTPYIEVNKSSYSIKKGATVALNYSVTGDFSAVRATVTEGNYIEYVSKRWDGDNLSGAFVYRGTSKGTAKVKLELLDRSDKVLDSHIITVNVTEPISSTVYSTGAYTVNHVNGVNVRSGAGTSYSIVGTASNKAPFSVSKISGDWGYTSSIKTGSGTKSGWVNLPYCKKGTVKVSFSSVKAPNGGTVQYGKGYHLSGKVVSTGGKISRITAQVIDSASNIRLSKSASVNADTYTLNGSPLDNALTFGKLPVGTYTLKYTVTADDGTTAVKSLAFKVIQSAPAAPQISESNSPGTITLGQSFSIKGKITSSSKLKSVSVGVYTASSGGSMQVGKTATPNAASYNLSNLDTNVKFGKLPAGVYYYRVSATNDGGTTTLINKKFTVSMPSGWFTLSPKNAPKTSLDVKGAGSANEVNVQIYGSNKSAAQQWKFKHLGDGWYTITARCSGKALDVKGGNGKSGTNVQQYSGNGTAAQKWYLQNSGDGYYYLLPQVNTSLALDVYEGRATNGTNVWVYTRNGTNAQRWKVTAVS